MAASVEGGHPQIMDMRRMANIWRMADISILLDVQQMSAICHLPDIHFLRDIHFPTNIPYRPHFLKLLKKMIYIINKKISFIVTYSVDSHPPY